MMPAKYLRQDDRRQPEEISSVLGSIIEHTSVEVDVRHGDLVGEWAEFAPGDWHLGTPVGVRDRMLLVTVPDGATASLLRYQTGPLMSVIAERFGAGLVTGVRLRVGSAQRPGSSRE